MVNHYQTSHILLIYNHSLWHTLSLISNEWICFQNCSSPDGFEISYDFKQSPNIHTNFDCKSTNSLVSRQRILLLKLETLFPKVSILPTFILWIGSYQCHLEKLFRFLDQLIIEEAAKALITNYICYYHLLKLLTLFRPGFLRAP